MVDRLDWPTCPRPRPPAAGRSSSPTAASTGPDRGCSGRWWPTTRAAGRRATDLAGATVEIDAGGPERRGGGRRSTVTTNDFGIGRGRVHDPRRPAAGRLDGARAHSAAAATMRVEEYKRPTFEVTLKDPTEPLRLNRPATLPGEARYYFGLPVTAGAVRWRVTREPAVPGGGVWWPGRRPGAVQQMVATGTADARRRTAPSRSPSRPRPTSASRDARRHLSLRIAADVTDEGGETRSAERAFRLGFVASRPRSTGRAGFLRAGRAAPVTRCARTDLDGVAARRRRAAGRLLSRCSSRRDACCRPTAAPRRRPDADRRPLPRRRATRCGRAGDPDYSTRGRCSPRWPDGLAARSRPAREPRRGGHGRADACPRSPAGAYRLRYETRDDVRRRRSQTWPRADRGAATDTPLALPALLVASSARRCRWAARPASWSTRASRTRPLILELWHRDASAVERRSSHRAATRRWSRSRSARRTAAASRVTLVTVRDHQLMQLRPSSVFVPWDDRELEVEFATFRDRSAPARGRPGG